MESKKKRQAIILIHGIGEQHPINTLREFVENLASYLEHDKKEARANEVVFWDKPDPISGNFETRKMTMRSGRKHPTTDFYEFYWAQHFRDTRFSHIKDWLQRLVFRNPVRVAPRLRKVFYFLWFLLLLLMGMAAYGLFTGSLNGWMNWIRNISGVVMTVVLAYFSHLLFNYLGDAARYLDPSPGNIEERQKIRTEGVALLRRLHESKQYNRIVIVSHSLGSVIGYDLVKFLWNEYYRIVDPARIATLIQQPEHRALFNQAHASEEAAKLLLNDACSMADYQRAQEASLHYLQQIGNPWLITDLVTIGSPLAHAGYLFAQQKDLFDKLVDQREYPVNPPHFQAPDRTNLIRGKQEIVANSTHPVQALRFNHSSPFAVTKWTNFYFEKDYVGGPLQPLFGKGIREEVVQNSVGFSLMPVGHTRYWDRSYPHHILAGLWEIVEGD
ncbi:MAG TPA: hypothetical protein PKK69_00020 [Ferruginibacter sp.]|nr:hypothetical protein [Ferruginibacter sp.]